jgi:uncharacterized membrane protein YphA (DoxX/SURF4 family)
MTSYGDMLVSTIALVGAVAALLAGLGPWRQPYQLRSVAKVADRYGMTAARSLWIAVAIISMVAGVAIAAGVRPSYAQPSPEPSQIQR